VDLSKPFLTVDEVAGILSLSRDTVIRKFEKHKGVIIIGSPETRFKRGYRTIRIPPETLEAFVAEHRVL
jgi:excisionase family DNA binding protein